MIVDGADDDIIERRNVGSVDIRDERGDVWMAWHGRRRGYHRPVSIRYSSYEMRLVPIKWRTRRAYSLDIMSLVS